MRWRTLLSIYTVPIAVMPLSAGVIACKGAGSGVTCSTQLHGCRTLGLRLRFVPSLDWECAHEIREIQPYRSIVVPLWGRVRGVNLLFTEMIPTLSPRSLSPPFRKSLRGKEPG